MKAIQRLALGALSLIVELCSLFVAFLSAGAGHGSYFWAKVLFPATMFSTVFFDSITAPFLVLALVQFPVYGIVISVVNEKKVTAFLLAAIHISLVTLCFVFVGESFN